MRNRAITRTLAFASILISLSGCRAVGDVFKAGMWVGVIIVVGVIALIAGVTRAARH
jgi:hypothetical protein